MTAPTSAPAPVAAPGPGVAPTPPPSAQAPPALPTAPSSPPAAPPPGPPPPPREPLWPVPRRDAPVAVLAGAGLTGLVVAATYPGQPAGVQVSAAVALAAATAVAGARLRPRALRRPSSAVLGVLVLLLGAVAAVRDASWLVALCLTAALGTGALVAVEGRTWSSGALALPAAAAASGRALPWAASRLRRGRRAARGAGWLRGTLIGFAVLWALAALLASADAVFGRLVGSVLPDVGLDGLVGRALLAVLVAGTALGVALAAASPPRWDRLAVPRGRGPAAEWAVPLALAVAVLGVFAAVQVVALVDPDAGLGGTGLTPAERARQGFGQLVGVTVLTIAVLGWTGRRSDPGEPRHRALMAGLGGALTLLLLAVVATALQRMWAYEQAFGWTVMRLLVAVFEVWLGVLVVLVAVCWAARRLRHLPRAAVASAALVLVALAAADPEGQVATRNVERFLAGGDLDTRYLAALSDDAVPALARLPEPERRCALGLRRPADTEWYAANLARSRAAGVLAAHDPVAPYALSCLPEGASGGSSGP